MAAVLPTVLNLFVALAGPHGTTMYVAPSQIVAIIGSPDVGACPTTLITMSQAVYVCESPAEVKRKLEAVTAPDLINCEKSAADSFNSWNTLMNAIQRPAWFSNIFPTMVVEPPVPSIAPSDPPRR
jgi:hypothetical protein